MGRLCARKNFDVRAAEKIDADMAAAALDDFKFSRDVYFAQNARRHALGVGARKYPARGI